MDDQNNFVYVISDSNSNQILKVTENVVETLKNSPFSSNNLWVRTKNYCIPIELDTSYFSKYPGIVHSEKIQNYDMAFPSIQVFRDLSHDTKILYIRLKDPNQTEFDIKVSINILPNEEDHNTSYLIQKIAEQFDIPLTIKEISIGNNKFEENSTIKNLFEQDFDEELIAVCEVSKEAFNDLINSRNSILSKIKDRENNFVSDLDKMINFWEPQVKELDIFLEESDDPFPKIKQLFELHTSLSKTLESHYEGYKTEYGPIFLYYSQPFHDSLNYLLNTTDFVLSVQNSLIFDESNEKLKELASQCNNVSFIDYLKKPKYHYESYAKNLSELQQATPKWHPDNTYLPIAIKEISSIIDQIKSNDDEEFNIDDEKEIKDLIDEDDDQDEVSDDMIKLLSEEVKNFEASSSSSQLKQVTDLDKVIKDIDENKSEDSTKGKYSTPPDGRRLSYDIKSEKDTTPQSLKKMLDFGDTKNVEKLMSLINSSDDEESILNKIDEVCSPRTKGRRYIDVDYNTIEPQPDVKDEFPKKGPNEMDKITISNSDMDFLNGQAKKGKKGRKKTNKDDKKENDSLVEQSNELTMFSNTKFVNHPEATDEIPVDISELKPIGFRTNRPFNYRNFFNGEKEDSSDFEMNSESSNGKNNEHNKRSPRKDSLFNRYYGDSTYSEVYLHLNHTRVVPKESPEETRSIFASPKRKSLNIGFYDLIKSPREVYSPEEQERRMNQFASDLDQKDDVNYINEAERKQINSPKEEQKRPFKAGKLSGKKEKKEGHKRRHSYKYENLTRNMKLNSNSKNNSQKVYKNRLSLSRLSPAGVQRASPGGINIKSDNEEDYDDDKTQLIQNITFNHKDDQFEEDDYDDDDDSKINKVSNDIPPVISFPFKVDSPIKIGNK